MLSYTIQFSKQSHRHLERSTSALRVASEADVVRRVLYPLRGAIHELKGEGKIVIESPPENTKSNRFPI
jgi:hypothetical protein